jgi:[acyl-carrier-protein] S-malonyltransferase
MKALIFPGQGLQETGMGSDFYGSEVFAVGSKVIGRDLAALCQSDTETLNRTENAQLAVFAVSMAAYDARRAGNEPPAAMAGFSLGECSALCAAGVFSLDDGFRLVQKRADVMMEACKNMNGAMSALLGGEPPEAYEDGGEWAVPVNFNCPGQIVVAGTPDGVAVLEERCKDSGGRAARLAVSGAFHTKMMAPAAAELRDFIKTLTVNPASVPVYSNLTGNILPEGTDISAHLEAQMTSSVLWQLSVENMLGAGITEFIETGHGSTLTKFIKRIKR